MSTPLDEAVARLRAWMAGARGSVTDSDLERVLAELDQRGADLERLRERDAKVRAILQRVDDEACKTDWSGNPDDLPEERPLDNEAVAMDMREALALLKEEP